MPKHKALRSRIGDKQPTFVTVDDLLMKAEDLVSGLTKLSGYKHPLAVRKARQREEVIDMHEESRQIKAGSRTYFVDIDTSREGRKYLRITESHLKGEGDSKERERVSILVFPEQAQEFAEAVADLIKKIA